jgi:homoserine O-succinyltransferase
MPLVAHTELPTFQRLSEEGEEILSAERAQKQNIRELHIGLLNLMPDAALEATERQFFRLVGACNQIAQFHVHPFTIEGIPRGPAAQAHIDKYYESFAQIQLDGLDALVISGANVTKAHLQEEAFWPPLMAVFDWAHQHVTSILCSCLATHAVFQHCYGIERTRLPNKRWGVFSHKVIDRTHPLMADINTRFDVPHSRYNEIFQSDMQAHGLKVLVASKEAGVHLAVSPDGFRIVFFQGHPEYDDISLLKEYKREVLRYSHFERDSYPPYPEHYFDTEVEQYLEDYSLHVKSAHDHGTALDPMPEAEIIKHLDNTWRDSAKGVFNNWLGKVYQITHEDRRLPFMDGIDPNNPLDL